MEAVARDRLGAPVTTVRTAAAGNGIHGKVTVSGVPGVAIGSCIDEVPRRGRKFDPRTCLWQRITAMNAMSRCIEAYQTIDLGRFFVLQEIATEPRQNGFRFSYDHIGSSV